AADDDPESLFQLRGVAVDERRDAAVLRHAVADGNQLRGRDGRPTPRDREVEPPEVAAVVLGLADDRVSDALGLGDLQVRVAADHDVDAGYLARAAAILGGARWRGG